MASGATVKLGVEGISQFKTNMNQAKQAVKTLDAQLTLTEKTFKQTGDAESYMTEKAELLKAKLEQQKTILANAEKALDDMKTRGIDRASKAYQDMYRQMVNAKAAMIDTQTQIDNVGASSETAAEDVSDMNTQLSNIGKGISWQNVTEGLEKITAGMEKVIGKAFKVGQAIVQATLGAGEWADQLQTTADQYEISPEQLYRMQQVADFIDTDVDTILSAQDKLAKNNSKKSEEFMGALAELGIDPTGKKNIDLFWEAGEAIANMGENADKTYYATQIFGKSWRELLPLFKAGRGAYNSAYRNASWIGDDNFKSLTELDDASQSLNNEWETLQKTFMGTLAGPMKEVLEILNGVLQEFNKYLQSEEGQQKMKELGETLTGWVKKLEDIDPGALIDSIKSGLEWIVNNAGSIVSAIEGFGIAFAGLKLAELVVNIGRLTNGFKGLLGLGGNDTVTTGGSGDKIYTGGKFNGTAAGLKLADFMANAQLWSSVNGGPIIDWMMNNSPWAPMLNGNETPGQWWNRMVSEQQERAANFGSNWDANSADANVLAKLGKNSILFWDGIHMQLVEAEKYNTGDHGGFEPGEPVKSQPTANWEFGDDWSIDEQMAWVSAQSAADKMAEVADDLSGDSAANRQSSSDMSSAAGTLKGMPGQVEEAILRGMGQIKIYIDGQQAGGVLTPYVNNAMAGLIAGFVKP